LARDGQASVFSELRQLVLPVPLRPGAIENEQWKCGTLWQSPLAWGLHQVAWKFVTSFKLS